jgi:hypothetical protein
MNSKYSVAYFRQRLDNSKKRLEEIDNTFSNNNNNNNNNNNSLQVVKKKRTYKEAFGCDNDYECVQEPNKDFVSVIYTNGNILWKDSYTENYFSNLKTTSST